jgi:polysaccharide export outer membrane protein
MIKNNHFFHTLMVMVFAVILVSPLLSCSVLEEGYNNLADTDPLAPLVLHENRGIEFANSNCPIIEGNTSYRLGADDKIEILVYNEQNLSNDYNIPQSGTLNLPLIGETMLGGCTVHQAEQLLHQKYADGYLVNPGISITVSEYRPFYVIGEVQQPGQYDYVVDMNALQAVAIAGGFTYRANKVKAKILKGQKNNQAVYQQIKIEEKIKPGDVIVIQERLF